MHARTIPENLSSAERRSPNPPPVSAAATQAAPTSNATWRTDEPAAKSVPVATRWGEPMRKPHATQTTTTTNVKNSKTARSKTIFSHNSKRHLVAKRVGELARRIPRRNARPVPR